MPGNGKYIDIDTEVAEGSLMDMRLGYCREIAESAGGKYYPLSGLRERSSKEIGLRSYRERIKTACVPAI
jgi:Mg-chelatase subunit ChlD